MVDAAPEAEVYCTDGYSGYLDVVFPGKHIFNIHNKMPLICTLQLSLSSSAGFDPNKSKY